MSQPDTYAPPQMAAAVDLDLSRNEGRMPEGIGPSLFPGSEFSRYPDTQGLQAALGRKLDLPTEQILLTSGADGALLRTCLATLAAGAEAVMTCPTFEMIDRYVAMASGTARRVTWREGAFPAEAFLAACNSKTKLAFIVSPNNPTGSTATLKDLRCIATALPNALVVLDAAYIEFAQKDLTWAALEFPNVVVLRTFSKAWGLAGLRVGYVLGSPSWIERLRACGNPFPVSSPSAALAKQRLEQGELDMRDYVQCVQAQRLELTARLASWGFRCSEPNESNFVLLLGVDPTWIAQALQTFGIGVRAFPGRAELETAVRITLPGRQVAFTRLVQSLAQIFAPQALLFDLDGVLADVSKSYREAILETARSFGVTCTSAGIEHRKRAGNANDDWALTHGLIEDAGVTADLAEVTRAFEQLYQGTDDRPGLKAAERALVTAKTLQRWSERFRLGVVTGRPRSDAEWFLERFGLLGAFDAVVCRGDAPAKPSPEPVLRCMRQLGVERAWMIGDTPDDMQSARAAGVLPVGVIAPGSKAEYAAQSLQQSGAAAVLGNVNELEAYLP